MNTVAVKVPQNVDINLKVMQDKIYAVIEAGKRQIKKLGWLFAHTPAYSDRLLRDRNLGPEFRLMKW